MDAVDHRERRSVAHSSHCCRDVVLSHTQTLSQLVEISDGDMRKSITVLQSAQKLRGMKNQLTPEDVMEVAGVSNDTTRDGVEWKCG
jgi:DNA polymerase III delta prime subunit